MDIFDEPNYRIVKHSSCLTGQWPYQSRQKKIIIITIIWIAFFMQFIPQLIAILVHLEERDVLFEAFSGIIIDLGFAIKYFNAIYKTAQMKELFERMRRDWRSLLNEEEKDSLQYRTTLGYLFSAAYVGIVGTTLMIFITEPIIPRFLNILLRMNGTAPRKFALPLEYIIIDREKHYWTILFISNLFCINIIVVIISCDITLITYVQHICGLFAVIGCRLKNTPADEDLPEDHKRRNNLSNTKNIPYKHLVSCIRGHRQALEFADLLESAYSVSLALIVGSNLPLITITGVQVVTQSNTIDKTLKYSTYAISQTAHLFFECFMSQQLTDMSLEMHESIADVGWYDISVKSQKLLILMTLRSQTPCKLTAAKIMDLSIENFAAMLKTCASYLTMLLSMQ
ncbi:odorant receptor 22c-like [Microplitis mediator]|uniref:odorant receptor 22c-like n=1 Tax=Microplitis mediator TaxID=375433 RepID=UPI0025531AF7|nr:odorant receptor 22c-like [Microplitis mediator]